MGLFKRRKPKKSFKFLFGGFLGGVENKLGGLIAMNYFWDPKIWPNKSATMVIERSFLVFSINQKGLFFFFFWLGSFFKN